MAPARMEGKNTGNVEAACTSATIRSQLEMVTSQLMATVCMSHPRLDICVAIQIERNIWSLERTDENLRAVRLFTFESPII